MTRVLVVGAGPAGTRCALRVAARLSGAAVTLVGAEPALPYDRVALSRYVAGELEQEALITHSLADLASNGVTYRAGTTVVSLDLASRRAVTASGKALDYDRCVLATGSRAVRLPFPGADLPGVVPWRDLAESRAMLRAAREGGPAVVIGGGLLGLEAAAGLAARGMKVTVLHAVGWPMERQLDTEAGALLAERLRGRGLKLVMPAATEAIEGTDRVEAVRLADGTRIPARLVVMAVGVRPETRLARSAGLECGRGIMVDDTLATSDSRISAIGECAEHRSLVYGLVLPAYEQAEVLARRLAGEDDAAYEGSVTYTSLKVSGVPVFSAGEVADEAPGEALLFRDLGHGIYKRLLLRDDRLVGAVLVGEVTDGAWYADLIRAGRDVAATRGLLAFGRALAEPAGGAVPPLGLAA